MAAELACLERALVMHAKVPGDRQNWYTSSLEVLRCIVSPAMETSPTQ